MEWDCEDGFSSRKRAGKSSENCSVVNNPDSLIYPI